MCMSYGDLGGVVTSWVAAGLVFSESWTNESKVLGFLNIVIFLFSRIVPVCQESFIFLVAYNISILLCLCHGPNPDAIRINQVSIYFHWRKNRKYHLQCQLQAIGDGFLEPPVTKSSHWKDDWDQLVMPAMGREKALVTCSGVTILSLECAASY